MSASTGHWPRPHRLTIDQYYRMAEVGLLSPDDRVELIEGEIVDMPPIGSAHAAVVTMLTKRLFAVVRDAADIRVQAPIRLGRRSEPHPDIALVTPRPDAYRHRHPVGPDTLLVIEVSESTLRFDLGVKARLYARHGIPEYWVVDLIEHCVHRHRRPAGNEYAERDKLSGGTARCVALDLDVDISNLS